MGYLQYHHIRIAFEILQSEYSKDYGKININFITSFSLSSLFLILACLHRIYINAEFPVVYLFSCLLNYSLDLVWGYQNEP